MKLYKLRFVLKGPDDEGERPYLAEVSALPGCRAWGDSAEEAMGNLQSVATAFLQSYQEKGDPLPQEIDDALVEEGPQIFSEVSIAV